VRPGGERVSIIDGISDMPWIPTGERYGLLTRIAMERVSLCAQMKN